jgi:hypothetical protein
MKELEKTMYFKAKPDILQAARIGNWIMMKADQQRWKILELKL